MNELIEKDVGHMSRKRTNRNNRYPFLPLILFIITYAVVQLYYVNYTLFAIALAFILSLCGIWYAVQAYTLNLSMAHALKQIDEMSNDDFLSFLILLFRRQGYAVKKNNDPFVHLILKKRSKKTLVHVHQERERITKKRIERLLVKKLQDQATSIMLITNRTFTKEEIQLAHANKINLIDRESLDAMLDVHFRERRYPLFIERARTFLTSHERNEL